MRKLEDICLFESVFFFNFVFKLCLVILAFTTSDFGIKMTLFGYAVLK